MVKQLLVGCSLAFSFAAFAADPPAGAPPAEMGPGARKVVKKDTKGIDALYKASDEAWKKKDMDAVAAMYDFPVFMMTDTMAGVVNGSMWTREDFIKNMKPMMDMVSPDTKMTHKHKITFMTDSMAMVEESNTMEMNKKKSSWTSSSQVIMKDGKWLWKSGTEGGWGEMMMAEAPKAPEMKPAPAAAPAKK